MQRRSLGSLEVSAVGLGCMTMTSYYGEGDAANALATLRRAPDIGVDFIDTSDSYGRGSNETLIGDAIAGHRNRYVIATKFGNFRDPDGSRSVNGRPEYVEAACDASCRRLGTDVIDLYYLHRVDPNVRIEDTVGAMARLVEHGKVRFLGLSEAAPETLRRAHAVHPIAALQTEYSLWTRDVESAILPTCRELGIGFVAYSPLGRGFLTGHVATSQPLAANDARRNMPRFQGANLKANARLVNRLAEMAEIERCTSAQVALAWLLSRGPNVVPIAGTSKISRLEENAKADDIKLPDATLKALEQLFLPGVAAGARATEALLQRLTL